MKARAGFTIIEIVLGLAVAGLIILMVFVALPALQRSQRDTARKNDISRLVSAITDYKTNNRGRAPFATSGQSRNLGAGQFVDDYLTLKAGGSGSGASFADPLGSEYQFVRQLDGGAGSGQILVTPGGRCDGDAPSGSGSGTGGLSSSAGLGSRSGAVRIKLEGGGQHCAEY